MHSWAVSGVFLLTFVPFCVLASPDMSKHVVLIGVDGLRVEALMEIIAECKEKQKFPHFRSLFEDGLVHYAMYSGEGNRRKKVKKPPSAGSDWTSVLTGVGVSKHRIRHDSDLLASKFNKKVPTIFNYVENLFPTTSTGSRTYTVSLVDWFPLSKLIIHKEQGCTHREIDVVKFLNYDIINVQSDQSTGKGPDYKPTRRSDKLIDFITNDEFMLNKTIEYLMEYNPRFLFLYLGSVGDTGRNYGFSPENHFYMASVRKIAEYLDLLVQEIDNLRRKSSPAHFLIALTAVNAAADLNERGVFLTLQDPKDPRYSGGTQTFSAQGQTVIVPTILEYFMGGEFRPGKPPYKFLGQPIRLTKSVEKSGENQVGKVVKVKEVGEENRGSNLISCNFLLMCALVVILDNHYRTSSN